MDEFHAEDVGVVVGSGFQAADGKRCVGGDVFDIARNRHACHRCRVGEQLDFAGERHRRFFHRAEGVVAVFGAEEAAEVGEGGVVQFDEALHGGIGVVGKRHGRAFVVEQPRCRVEVGRGEERATACDVAAQGFGLFVRRAGVGDDGRVVVAVVELDGEFVGGTLARFA